MLFKKKRPEIIFDEEGLEAIQRLEASADLVGYPKQWIACPFCAQHSWRFPPHCFDPCPVVIAAAESQGMKTDAERMTAIRTGLHLEQANRAMLAFLQQHGLIEEEDESGEDE